MLKENDKAPAWKAKDQDGTERSSDEFAGKWLLFYFYPEDDTPGCTEEACGLRDHYAVLSSRIAIVGVSPDTVESHKKFAEKFQLPFTLIADTDKKIIAAYGTDGVTMKERTTFLIGPDQIIRKIYHVVDTKTHAKDVDTDLQAFGF